MLDRLREKEIINNIRLHSNQGWYSLYDAYANKLWKRIRLFFPNDQSANETLTNAIHLAAVTSTKIQANKSLWMWLWTISSKHINKEYQRKFRTDRLDAAKNNLHSNIDEVKTSRTITADIISNTANQKDLAEIVRHTLNRLNDYQQCLIIAKCLDQLTIRQLSRELDRSGDEVKTLLTETYQAFRKQFESLSGFILEKETSEQSDHIITSLLSLLDEVDMPADEMFLDMLRSKSLEDFIAGPANIGEKIQKYNTNYTKIAVLAVLSIALVALVIIMNGKARETKEKLKTEFLKTDQLIQTQTQPETKQPGTIEKLETIETPQQAEYLKKLEEYFLVAKQLADKNDIPALVKMVEESELVGKMIAARFLGLIGDDSAIEALQKQSDAWIGDEDSNIFAAAIENIQKRSAQKTQTSPQTKEPSKKDINFEISGQVLSPYSQPLDDAQVGVYFGYQFEKADFQAAKPTTTVKTSKDGQFDLNFSLAAKYFNTGQLTIVVKHPDHALAWSTIDKTSDNIIFLTAEKSFIAGYVVDENDQPIANAQVLADIAYSKDAQPLRANLSNDLITKTDAQGYFEFTSLPAETLADIRVYDEKHVSYNSSNETPLAYKAGQDNIKIQLTSGRKLAGELIDKDGDSVAGTIYFDENNLTVKTNEAGEFEIVYPELDIAFGYAFDNTKKMAASFAIDMNQLGTENALLQLLPGVTISSKVVDENGQPIVDASFRILFRINGSDFMVSPWDQWLADYKNDGSFTLENIPTGLPFEVYIQSSIGSQAIPLENITAGQNIELEPITLGE